MSAPRTVAVLAGGPRSSPISIPDGAIIVAADAGVELVPGHVDVAVGDFDSAAPASLARADRIERHPREKDATDLALALDVAMRFEPERILVIGSDGGRLDHLFGSLLLLADDDYAGPVVDAALGDALVHVVRGTRTLDGRPGELISLFAIRGAAAGVTTTGLRYALDDEPLAAGSSRGTSNEFVAATATISVRTGVVLAIRPHGSVPAGTAW